MGGLGLLVPVCVFAFGGLTFGCKFKLLTERSAVQSGVVTDLRSSLCFMGVFCLFFTDRRAVSLRSSRLVEAEDSS